MSTWLTMSASLFWIVIWKPGCPCVVVCVCLYVLQSSCFGPTPWLKCVHASVHILMSIWVQNIGTPPLHSYMETWVPGCGTVCMFQSVHFWSHTLFRMCTFRRRCRIRWGVTETLTWGHPGAHMLASTMWRGGANLGSQEDMPACADACTHYNLGVGTDELWLEYADWATPGWTGLNTTMLRAWVGLH